jgi:hypothetical protein
VNAVYTVDSYRRMYDWPYAMVAIAALEYRDLVPRRVTRPRELTFRGKKLSIVMHPALDL